MTQLVVVSTFFGAMSAAAAVDSGLLGVPDGERVLLVVNNASAPELTPAVDEIEGSATVLARFDRVVHLTDLIAPIHPSNWNPDRREHPLLERLFRRYWGLGDGRVDVVVETIWFRPAQTLARIFGCGGITVYSDGLMGYGPTHGTLPLDIVQRLDSLLYLDLVPGVRPVLLSEHGVTPTLIPSDAFLKIIDEVAIQCGLKSGQKTPSMAIVVGQYLAALGMMSRTQEAELHGRMIAEAAGTGVQIVRFKPHPSAPPGLLAPIERAARDAGVTLEVVADPRPVEVMLASSNVVAIVGCFSTSLMTARTIFGIRSIAVGTQELLESLEPYEESNRIPVTLIDALHREDSALSSAGTLQHLVNAVSYCMRPHMYPGWRGHTAAWIEAADSYDLLRYFTPKRLSMLGLSGALTGRE